MPRQQDRIPFLTEIVFEALSGRHASRISDLSNGGCFADSIAPVQEGEELNFLLKLESGDSMPFTGRVAYVMERVGFGISFTNLTDERKAFVDNIMRSRSES
jgi:PilZ domain